MYVWELVSCRLRFDGWSVWHSSTADSLGPTYTVHLQRPGVDYEASGPTLTEAYAVAARRAREYINAVTASATAASNATPAGAPHFPRGALTARA